MRVAVAGAGDLGRYVVEELVKASHTVVVLSRTKKPWCVGRNISFQKTDYSVPSLVSALTDCEALISTILDYSLDSATVHLALLEACRLSEKCKRYIPSEYGGDIAQYPDQPAFYAANHQPVRAALRNQDEIMWTLFNCGWLSDYFIPAGKRYIKDIGEYHPVDLNAGTLTFPGNGDNLMTFTPARDVAAGLAKLVSCENWEEVTYISGDTATWNQVKSLLERRGLTFKTSYIPREVIEEQVTKAESEEKVIIAQYNLFSISGAALLPKDIAKIHREKYFDGVKIRSLPEFMDDAARANEGTAV